MSTLGKASINELFVVLNGEKYDLGRGTALIELLDGFNATHPRHGDINDDYIRVKTLYLGNKLRAIARCANELKIRFKQDRLSLQEIGMIVSQENTWSAMVWHMSK